MTFVACYLFGAIVFQPALSRIAIHLARARARFAAIRARRRPAGKAATSKRTRTTRNQPALALVRWRRLRGRPGHAPFRVSIESAIGRLALLGALTRSQQPAQLCSVRFSSTGLRSKRASARIRRPLLRQMSSTFTLARPTRPSVSIRLTGAGAQVPASSPPPMLAARSAGRCALSRAALPIRTGNKEFNRAPSVD